MATLLNNTKIGNSTIAQGSTFTYTLPTVTANDNIVTDTSTSTLTNKTLSSPIINSSLNITSTGNANIEIGRQDGTTSTPFIDFHSGATPVDYDARIIASGGTGVIGGGQLQIYASGGLTVSAPVALTTTLYTGNTFISGTEVGVNKTATSDTNSLLRFYSVANGAIGADIIRYSGANGVLAFNQNGTGQVDFRRDSSVIGRFKATTNEFEAYTGISFNSTTANSDAKTLDAYEEGTFTFTLTGVTTTVTGTATYVLVGKSVSLEIPQITGTSNATTMTLTGLPSHLIPSSARDIVVRTVDNSATIPSLTRGMVVNITGVVSLYTNLLATGWTASGTKGVHRTSVNYIL